jgi:hypothetical protein
VLVSGPKFHTIADSYLCVHLCFKKGQHISPQQVKLG